MNDFDHLVSAFERGRLTKAIKDIRGREATRLHKAIESASRASQAPENRGRQTSMPQSLKTEASPPLKSGTKSLTKGASQMQKATLAQAQRSLQDGVKAGTLTVLEAATLEDKLNDGSLAPEKVVDAINKATNPLPSQPAFTPLRQEGRPGELKKSRGTLRVSTADARRALSRAVASGAISVIEASKGEEYLNTGRSSPVEVVNSIIGRARQKTADLETERRLAENRMNRIPQNGLEQRMRELGKRSGLQAMRELEDRNFRVTHF